MVFLTFVAGDQTPNTTAARTRGDLNKIYLFSKGRSSVLKHSSPAVNRPKHRWPLIGVCLGLTMGFFGFIGSFQSFGE
jgi:hypothetical protein